MRLAERNGHWRSHRSTERRFNDFGRIACQRSGSYAVEHGTKLRRSEVPGEKRHRTQTARRARMMSEAKSKGRPTMVEGATGRVVTSATAVSNEAPVRSTTAARSRSARRVKDVVVTVRMTAQDAEALAFVQGELGAKSGPDALREAVRQVAGLLRSETYRSGIAQRPAVVADSALLAEIRDGLRAVETRTNERTRELHFVSHNWNMIAKVADATGAVDINAIRGVERALVDIRRQMEDDARHDTKAQKVLACLLQ